MDRFSSDLHLGHRGGYLSCERDRDFRSLNHMNRSIIRAWNETVTDEDTVFLLGDFCYRSSRPASSWLNEMNHGARLVFVKGNHDQWLDVMPPEEKHRHFQLVIEDTCVIERNGFRVGLTHVPTDTFQVPVDLIVCGHIHNNRQGIDYENFMRIPNIVNCSVEINDYRPVSLRELVQNNQCFYNRTYDNIPEELFQAFE